MKKAIEHSSCHSFGGGERNFNSPNVLEVTHREKRHHRPFIHFDDNLVPFHSILRQSRRVMSLLLWEGRDGLGVVEPD